MVDDLEFEMVKDKMLGGCGPLKYISASLHSNYSTDLERNHRTCNSYSKCLTNNVIDAL